MHISAHKFFSFNAIVCYVLQRTITHKTTPLLVVRIFFSNCCSYFSPGIVLAMHRKVAWSQSNHEIFPIWKPLRCLPPWLWLIKNDFLFAGYGNIVPITVQARLFGVLYALIGMPWTCLTRKSIGDKITELFTKLITNRLLWETRFEKITSDWKSGAKSYVDIDCVSVVCLLSLMTLLHGLRETQGMVIYQVFSIYFHDFECNWFGWLLSAI